MKTWVIVLLCLLAHVVQTSLLDHAVLWGVRPDLVLIMVCIVAIRRGPLDGAVAGAIAGFFVDLASGRLIGLGTLGKTVAGASVGWAGQRVFGDNVMAVVGMTAAGSVIEQGIYIFGAWAFGFPFPLAESIVRIALPSLWYDAAASAVVYPLFFLLERRIGRAGAKERPGPVHD